MSVSDLFERAFGWSSEYVESLQFDERQSDALYEALGKVRFFDGTGADAKPKTSEFVCHCGCGQTFEAEWRTKRPKYVNPTHKMRAYRKRNQS